jgi:competence protein ComEC
LFASLPLASISVPIPNIAEVGLLYVVLLSLMAVQTRRHFALACALFLLGSFGWGYYWWRERWNRSELRITHLSVGQGDAAVVEFPGRKVLILDAGGTAGGEFDPGESIVAPFLRARKIRDVDYLVLAHPRIDHYGGMKAIVQQFSLHEFWSGSGGNESAAYRELEEALARSKVRRRVLDGRDPCRIIEGVELCVIGGANETDAEASLVIRLAYRGASFLFAGDIGAREEKSLLAQRVLLRSTVMKIPRHGSANSSTEEFVSAAKPRLAVLSVGERNPFGLPRAEVLARYRRVGAEILRTDEDGAVIVKTDGRKLTYQAYRSGRRGNLLLDVLS